MSSPASLDATSGALVSSSTGAVLPGGAPRSHAPVVLSLDASNYTKWSIYVKASLGRAGLIGHIDGTTAATRADATWSSNDYTVLHHLHSGIDEDVADMVLARDQTARQLWLAIHELFTANKTSKAIYLDNDFRQLAQGASSITEYCRRQKQLSDSLADNDSPVSDRALVLNTLRGLGPRFASAATIISMTDPLPSFLRTRSMLLMEEMQQSNAAANAASTALVAQAPRFPAPSATCTGTACRGESSTSGKARDTGQWRAPNAPGILGPRPQAYHTTSAPLFSSAPSSTAPATWDNSALIAALNNLALQQGGWVMDSGASSHMTYDDGNISLAAPRPVSPSPSLSRRLDFLFADPLVVPAATPPVSAAGSSAAPPRQPATTSPGRSAAAPPQPAVAPRQTAAPRQPAAARSPIGTAPSARERSTTSTLPAAPPPRMSRSGRVVRPVDRLNLSAVDAPADPVPTTFRQAMQDPRWRTAMAEEHQALIDNGTWSLVPRPPQANIVTGKWIFRQKFHSDGSLARYKARWVVRGFSQRPGIDYDETFSPVVKPATIRLVLHIAVSSSWPIRQLDVKNAFLHGNLDEVVYCQQPPGFVDPSRPDHVCRLHKSLYGLKQAPRAWYQRFATYLATMGFTASKTDTSLFVLRSGSDTAYLLLYVDDIIVTASSTGFLQRLLKRLHSEFAMTDLGDLHFFLGIAMSSSTPPPTSEPILAIPLSSAPPPFAPIRLDPSKDSGKETEGTSANPEKTSGADQTEHKAEEVVKKSKARQRDSEAKGKWWPCTTTEMELKNLEAESFLQPGSWRSVPNALAPAPEDNEMVLTKALVERGFSFPPSDFFLEILKVYGLQPHNISPNSVLAISNHVTLCEGHLRVPPELSLFQYYFSVKKEKVRQSTELATCGSITFMIRPGRVYPHTDRHESARYCSKPLKKMNSELSSGFLPPATRIRKLHQRRKLAMPHAPLRGKELLPPAPRPNVPATYLASRQLARPKPDPKDVINVDDIPEDPAAETAQGDSGKGASSSAPPPEQPTGTSAEPTAEQYEQKVQLIHATGASKTPSLQKLPLSQRHAEISAMMEKVWGPADTEMKELSDLESELKVFFAKHKEVRQSTRKLHEDLRVHVLEQMTEIEGLRQNDESSRQAVLRLEARLKEETDKRPTIDALSAKIQVLEAENESLKNFLKETSEKETKEKKELSEKHAREMAELADKLKKSHQRVTTLAAKNKSQEAEAEAIDKLIFPSLGFEWTKESTLPRTEAYDEARTSIVNLVEACRGIAKSLSLKKAKTTVIDRMTKLMQNVPELIKDWQESSSRGVAALVLATCKVHFPTMKFADVARGVHKDTVMRQHLSEAMGFDRLFAGRVNHSFWYNKYDLPKGFSDPEEEEEAAEEGDEEGSGSSADHDEEDSDLDDGGSDGGSDDGSAYVASDEEQSSENL
ncbi:hypothetical protein QYE76_069791 [Lolium multiflorum]|uniref:Reverse transcriptase Ty1/copia-type domain-containing protein n=1 Tax=Lolium multiflorum TaxID=4521 RepID=A0AAD8SIG5_LOLMU|nr:hypothetical protein QYE76_069791 [Lolium multiflorum]